MGKKKTNIVRKQEHDNTHDEIKKKKLLSWWDKRKLKKNPEKCFIITMMHKNGTSKTFVIKPKDNTFDYSKKMYAILPDECWFDLSLNEYHFFYNEGCPTPINREIHFETEKTYNHDGEIIKESDAYFSVSPHNLKEIIKMEYVKALSNSVELSKYLKINAVMGFIAVGLNLVIVFMLYSKFFR